MAYQLYLYILSTLFFNAVFADNEGIHSIQNVGYVQIQGLVENPSGIDREEFFTTCRVYVNGGQQIAFLRCDKHGRKPYWTEVQRVPALFTQNKIISFDHLNLSCERLSPSPL